MEKKTLDFLILKALKEEEQYLSGEELASDLGISRQALWRHMAKLIEMGYEIVAVPHLGYKLISSPDKLYPWEIQYKLDTKFIGKNVHYREVLDSTQSVAWELGLKNFPEGTLIISEVQKQGRGRLGRRWFSPTGGIYLSLILRPDFILISEIPQITLLIGLSCLYGIKKTAGIECSLKWPNDLLLREKKLGGILCEVSAELDKINFVVVGIGINVNTRDLPPGATSLFFQTKRNFSRIDITKKILEEVERCYRRTKKEGFSSLLKEWERFCLLWGTRVGVKVMHERIEGEATGIDEKGCLLLRRDDGSIKRISAGDIVKCKPKNKIS